MVDTLSLNRSFGCESTSDLLLVLVPVLYLYDSDVELLRRSSLTIALAIDFDALHFDDLLDSIEEETRVLVSSGVVVDVVVLKELFDTLDLTPGVLNCRPFDCSNRVRAGSSND